MLSSALASHNWHQLSRRTGRSPVNALPTEKLSQKKCRGSLYVGACVDVRINACVNAEKVHVSDQWSLSLLCMDVHYNNIWCHCRIHCRCIGWRSLHAVDNVRKSHRKNVEVWPCLICMVLAINTVHVHNYVTYRGKVLGLTVSTYMAWVLAVHHDNVCSYTKYMEVRVFRSGTLYLKIFMLGHVRNFSVDDKWLNKNLLRLNWLWGGAIISGHTCSYIAIAMACLGLNENTHVLKIIIIMNVMKCTTRNVMMHVLSTLLFLLFCSCPHPTTLQPQPVLP